ncbi:MAG: monovalent cation/H(+) antiporter subunit G [Burkholderiaceae bacterium]|nr:monovalent cation/H(+) antiporter subunit G [Burkholderiaceae bacterium]
MNAAQVPLWAAVPVTLLLLLAGCLVVIGSLGLLRLSNFYQRSHGPAMINTLGAGCILIASMLYFTALQSRPVVHELLITVAVVLTSPVTAMLLMRAAVYRDRRNKRNDVPAHPAAAGRGVSTGERQA